MSLGLKQSPLRGEIIIYTLLQLVGCLFIFGLHLEFGCRLKVCWLELVDSSLLGGWLRWLQQANFQ